MQCTQFHLFYFYVSVFNAKHFIFTTFPLFFHHLTSCVKLKFFSFKFFYVSVKSWQLFISNNLAAAALMIQFQKISAFAAFYFPLYSLHLFPFVRWINSISNEWSKRSKQFKNADERMNVTFYVSFPGHMFWLHPFLIHFRIRNSRCVMSPTHSDKTKQTKTK